MARRRDSDLRPRGICETCGAAVDKLMAWGFAKYECEPCAEKTRARMRARWESSFIDAAKRLGVLPCGASE